MEMGRTSRCGSASERGPDGENAPVLQARLARLSQRVQVEFNAMRIGQKDRAFLATSHGTNYQSSQTGEWFGGAEETR